ncbi:protein-disulfide reductase DsbD [Marinobacterium sp. AK62]|uniref:Thiol:disulfide interchange protein DsbD n=1 Tax=Marinobacterium alkalitolerans TaxID=1542925 RepID=A0ABS3ZAG0_9GAMM|nr:protein-disulfide reductase DsbD [Marinobacterium alkalitolerans]MBP0048683.1 protein-disulfide reductase DsbD [Marinobacterium alkalitolerans]
MRLFIFPLLLAVSLVASPSFANPFGSNGADGPLMVEEAFRLRVEVPATGVTRLVWQVEPDYYLYRERIEVSVPEGIELVDRRDISGDMKDDPLFGRVEVYHEQAQVDLLLGRRDGADAGADISVTYQGCWEGGVCYPPVTQQISVDNLPLAAGLGWPEMPKASGEQTRDQSAQLENVLPQTEQDRFAGLLAGEDRLLMLGAFFLAGLALSFTPCVLPMIPILSSLIAGQGHRSSTRRGFMLSLVYVLAMALTYTLAGILAGLFGANLQAALQNPWVIGTFSALFVVLAMSMFGFYDLQVPAALQSRLNNLSHRQKGGTLLGVAIMGVLSALIVGPCMAAPLAGALIYIGQSGDPVLGGSALFSLSLGMGVPLLLVGASAGRLLPRAGAWMEGVKAGFGVVLLLMAVWMLDRILPTEITMLLLALVLIISAVYLKALDKLDAKASGWHRFWKGVGVVMLIYGGALMLGVLAGGQSLLYPLQGVTSAVAGDSSSSQKQKLAFEVVTRESELDRLLTQARANNQPVMLDFYADWCISCIELDYVTFSDAGVQASLKDFKLIKLDVTENDDQAKRLYKRFNIIGPPALIFYDAGGDIRPEMTMIGVIDPPDFIAQVSRIQL